MEDIERQQNEARRQLEAMPIYAEYQRLKALRNQIYQMMKSVKAESAATTKEIRPRLGSDGKITVGDGSYEILKTDRSLHVKVIADKLTAMGRPTNPNSVSGALHQDPRFRLLGENVFTLTEYYNVEKLKFDAKERIAKGSEDYFGGLAELENELKNQKA